MDVDEDDDGTQQVKKVADYGIEVDFDALDDDEREVGIVKIERSVRATYNLSLFALEQHCRGRSRV